MSEEELQAKGVGVAHDADAEAAAAVARAVKFAEEAPKALEDREWETRPRPALVNGEPIVVGQLPDGRHILVAANQLGEPYRDLHNNYVVIDPQSGSLRFKKVSQVYNPDRTPMPMDNGLEFAQRCLCPRGDGKFNRGFLAFLNNLKVNPPIRGVAKFRKMSRAKQLFVVFFANQLLRVYRALKFFRGKIAKAKYWLKHRKDPYQTLFGAALKTELVNIDRFLTEPARELHNTEHKSWMLEVDGPGRLAFSRMAAVMVPIEPDGTISDKYLRRWGNFLNDLCYTGLWQHGVLGKSSTLELAAQGLRRERVLYCLLYTDQIHEDSFYYGAKKPSDVLNAEVGFPVFVEPGSFNMETDWDEFPW